MNEALAKKRFMLLNLVRLSAIVFIFLGAANIKGDLLPDVAPYLGYALMVIGAVDFFATPAVLKHMWRQQDQ